MSYQERLSGNQAPALVAIPLWLFSCALLHSMKAGQFLFGYVGRAVRDCRRAAGGDTLNQKNDVYFMVGLLTTIGLSAKTLF